MLALSAKIIGAEVLFVILGKSIIYRRKRRGPKTQPHGTPSLTLAQVETSLLLPLIIYCCSEIPVIHVRLKKCTILAIDCTKIQFRK